MAIILGTVIEILSIVGLLLTFLFLMTLIRFGYLKDDVPFIIIFNLALSYFCHLCIITFHSAPEVILGHDPFAEELEHAAKFAYVCFWYVTLCCQILVAANRYIAVCHFQRLKTAFSLLRVRLICVAGWVIGLLAAIPEVGVCCRLVFDTHLVKTISPNGTFDSSSEEMDGEYGHIAKSSEELNFGSHEVHEGATEMTDYQKQTNWVLVATHILNFLTMLIMVNFYVRIFIRVKQTQQASGRQTKTNQIEPAPSKSGSDKGQAEVAGTSGAKPQQHLAPPPNKWAETRSSNQQRRIQRMSVQMFILSFVFTVFSVFQVLVQFVFTNVVMMLILQFAYLLNSSIVPLVFLVLNAKLRNQMVATLLFRSKNSVSDVRTAPAQSHRTRMVGRSGV